MDMTHQIHEFAPVYDGTSEILILGTFPSVKSREQKFYYGHPQNRFWRVIAALTDSEIPKEIDEKKNLLLKNHIAVWDVIESCDIKGSSDSSIKNVVPCDIAGLLHKTRIKSLYANGTAAKRLYDRFILPKTQVPIILLPSTSPANAAYSVERLIKSWSVIHF